MLKTSGQNNLLQTIKEVYSSDVVQNLKEVLKTDELSKLRISGYVSTPNYTRSSKKSYYMYINSRAVKDPVFQKSIDTAYKALIASGKYPFVVLNLEIPPTDVDVNVHPTKKEVRYKNTNQIFNFIYTAIQGGLSNFVEQQVQKFEQFKSEPSQNVVDFVQPKLEQKGEAYFDKKEDTIYISDKAFKNLEEHHAQTSEQKQFFKPVEKEDEIEENIIGQYKNTYILIEKEDGLEIVDQHIAEERYNYEKLRENKEISSQMLFISDVIEVSSSEAELIKENIEKFEKFGFGIEFTKSNEVVFRKVPQILAKVNPKEIISDILENIEGDIDGLEERIMRTTACKASVKAGQKLSLWQMQEIIKKWRTTKMPYTCPHGRPITHTIKHKEIAGFFQRNE